MEYSPPNRCGYTYPPDHVVGDSPDRQSCCNRQSVTDADRCVWHVDPDQTDYKTIENLRLLQGSGDHRALNKRFGGLLDGAVLVGMELNPLSFENTSLRGANLRNTNLAGANLNAANLTEADLNEANLASASLEKADFTRANLFMADLTEANLLLAKMRGADLVNADLTEALLVHADMSEAELNIANLTEATLSGANLAHAKLPMADLTKAMLGEVDLTEANLGEADLTDAYLRKADLTDAELVNADLTETELREANLSGANFLRARLVGAILPGADELRKANFTEADLQGQDFRGEDLSGANLAKANLTGCELSQADLSNANLERALLNRADLFDARLAGARLEGTVLGNIQVNEGTFKRLAPESIESSSSRSIRSFLRNILLGPTGNNAYRCVYDPASGFDLWSAHDENQVSNDSGVPDEKAEQRGGPNNVEDDPEVRAGGVYRQFERIAGENALPEWQRRFFILRQDMQVRQSSGLGYAFAVVQRALFGYGESFSRVVGWSGTIIGLFAVAYLSGGWIRPVRGGGRLGRPVSWAQLPDDPSVLWESLYYSTLTFTALGFGDFRPVGSLGQFLTVLESASGALLLALLVFVLGRRAAR